MVGFDPCLIATARNLQYGSRQHPIRFTPGVGRAGLSMPDSVPGGWMTGSQEATASHKLDAIHFEAPDRMVGSAPHPLIGHYCMQIIAATWAFELTFSEAER